MQGIATIPGRRFSLGLWIGSSASPNKIAQARKEVTEFRTEHRKGNPLILTECPWCRAEIGRFDGPKPSGIAKNEWRAQRVRGISEHPTEGPLLLCPDSACAFGSERWADWLPVEVIDERIYDKPPSLVIATADKFAMIAFRRKAGTLFGRSISDGGTRQVTVPPGLIVQDELHLISGPLGTIYGLYEGIFERLCSHRVGDTWIKPKLIASTATIRGAAEQVLALYARTRLRLFPSPGLRMGDSFFGTYAREGNGQLSPGRLYLGIHANDYGSVLTTQVRTFSSALFRPEFIRSRASRRVVVVAGFLQQSSRTRRRKDSVRFRHPLPLEIHLQQGELHASASPQPARRRGADQSPLPTRDRRDDGRPVNRLCRSRQQGARRMSRFQYHRSRCRYRQTLADGASSGSPRQRRSTSR